MLSVLPSSVTRYALSGVGGALLIAGLTVLSCIDQDDARHSFGHTGGMVHEPSFLPLHSALIDGIPLIM